MTVARQHGGDQRASAFLGEVIAEIPRTQTRKHVRHGWVLGGARVALVGNHIAAGNGSVKADGTHVRTLWGELAWQLGVAQGRATGARDSFEIVEDADVTRSDPGAALHALIALHAPCLILIDEWVAYARQLFGRDDLDGGTFDTQFTFAQTLTEVVKQVPGAMLVMSIPASPDTPSDEELERAGSGRFCRGSSRWRPSRADFRPSPE